MRERAEFETVNRQRNQTVKLETESGPEADRLPSQQMSRLWAKLMVRAAVCAAAMALVAGLMAAVIGS